MKVLDGILLATSEETGSSFWLTSFTGDLLGPWLVTMNLGAAPVTTSSRTLRTDGLRLCVLCACSCDDDLLGTLQCGMA